MSLATFRLFVPYCELIAAVVGTIYFYKYRHTPLKYFLFLLWYITITEFSGWYIIENDVTILIAVDSNGIKYNWWMYNLLRFITFNTLYFIYYKYLKTKAFKRWTKFFIIFYSIVSLINWSFIQSFYFNTSEIPRVVGSIFLIITIFFYFAETLRSEKIALYYKMLLFWISGGLLLFYSGTIPFTLKVQGYSLLPEIHKLFLIFYILAIIMYLTFTFGFIWSKKESGETS